IREVGARSAWPIRAACGLACPEAASPCSRIGRKCSRLDRSHNNMLSRDACEAKISLAADPAARRGAIAVLGETAIHLGTFGGRANPRLAHRRLSARIS